MIQRLIFIIGLFCIGPLWGQSDTCASCGMGLMRVDSVSVIRESNQRSFSLNFVGGFLVPHHEDMTQMYHHIQSVQFRYLRNYSISKQGYRLNSNQQMGCFVGYYNFGSNITGKGIALGLDFNSAIIGESFNSKHRLSLDWVMGLGYINQTYDPSTNPENRAIGSHVNAYAQLGLLYEFRFLRTWNLGINLSMAHFSNASWKSPNLGINLPSVGLNIKKRIFHPPTTLIKNLPLPKMLFSTQYISLRFGHKEYDIDDNRGFTMVMVEYQREIPMSLLGKLRLGTSIYYDPTYGFEKFSPLPQYSVKGTTEIGINVGYESRFGAWGLLTDIGLYVYKPISGAKKPYYEGLGLRYYVNRNWSGILRLKANGTVADFAEMGIAYKP